MRRTDVNKCNILFIGVCIRNICIILYIVQYLWSLKLLWSSVFGIFHIVRFISFRFVSVWFHLIWFHFIYLFFSFLKWHFIPLPALFRSPSFFQQLRTQRFQAKAFVENSFGFRLPLCILFNNFKNLENMRWQQE